MAFLNVYDLQAAVERLKYSRMLIETRRNKSVYSSFNRNIKSYFTHAFTENNKNSFMLVFP